MLNSGRRDRSTEGGGGMDVGRWTGRRTEGTVGTGAAGRLVVRGAGAGRWGTPGPGARADRARSSETGDREIGRRRRRAHSGPACGERAAAGL
ncbi:hypothetical protein CERSUDRAFT_101621 [Gelatoporia subvermispora B]|uniref:Uncharacterized protein n=1 Tax=Ceriporiopsis subvermispora (strain B) TaxID=914234 RepID=M2QE30_CERS8|nr:hypothetical protein CERSUDRAFT_101621 [Gelatoporia subvermispora B]